MFIMLGKLEKKKGWIKLEKEYYFSKSLIKVCNLLFNYFEIVIVICLNYFLFFEWFLELFFL